MFATRHACVVLIAAAVGASIAANAALADDPNTTEEPSHEAQIAEWRKGRMERLLSDNGYLALAGLFWLHEGKHSFGSASDNDFVFPKHSAPAHAGAFVHANGVTTVRANPGTPLRHEGEPVTEMRMVPDSEDGTTMFTLGDLTFYLIQRADRFGIRMRDVHSEIRKNFRGIESYPVQESYRVVARFEPYDPPKEIPVVNEIGTTSTMLSPGALVFTLNGQECRLDPVVGSLDDDDYFVIFRDATSGDETYGSGRFLYTDLPADGQVIVDFNKAYNPPCAFSPYTTCPLPPPQNELKVAVRAGEKAYGDSADTAKH
jgi:uncharacterized protein (DUF1684 family)